MKYRVTITEVETGKVCVDEVEDAVLLCGADEKRARRVQLVDGAPYKCFAAVLYHAQNMISEAMVEHPELEEIFERTAEFEAKEATEAEAETEKEAEQE